MPALARALIVAMSLLVGGVFELAAAIEDVSCCEGSDEREAPGPDCPAGVLCACCPASVVPARHPGVVAPSSVLATAPSAVPEPSLSAAVTDIFHPPRA